MGGNGDQPPSIGPDPVAVLRVLPSREEDQRLRKLPHRDGVPEQPHL